MKKQGKKKRTQTTRKRDGSGPRDSTATFEQLNEAFDWVLDVAVRLAQDYPEEVEAVERVRAFMHKRINGEAVELDVDDVLFTIALIIAAIDRDLEPVTNVRPWFATAMRFPSVEELWKPPLRRHVLMTIHPRNRAFA